MKVTIDKWSCFIRMLRKWFPALIPFWCLVEILNFVIYWSFLSKKAPIVWNCSNWNEQLISVVMDNNVLEYQIFKAIKDIRNKIENLKSVSKIYFNVHTQPLQVDIYMTDLFYINKDNRSLSHHRFTTTGTSQCRQSLRL